MVFSDSYKVLEKIKADLIGLSLKNFPGENVRLLNQQVERYADILDCAGFITAPMLCQLAKIYEGASDSRFSQWATMNLYDPCVEYSKDLRITDVTSLHFKLIASKWSYKKIIEKTNVKYDEMFKAGRYSSALKKAAEDPIPQGFVAKFEAMAGELAELKQKAIDNKAERGTGHTTSGHYQGKCDNCGKYNHRTVDCRNKVETDITINGTEYTLSNNDWKSIVPTDVTTVIQSGKNHWRWCATCKKWMYHSTERHDGWAARQAARNGEKKSTNTALVAVPPPDNDSGFCFF